MRRRPDAFHWTQTSTPELGTNGTSVAGPRKDIIGSPAPALGDRLGHVADRPDLEWTPYDRYSFRLKE
jgi:hypothetical protein